MLICGTSAGAVPFNIRAPFVAPGAWIESPGEENSSGFFVVAMTACCRSGTARLVCGVCARHGAPYSPQIEQPREAGAKTTLIALSA